MAVKRDHPNPEMAAALIAARNNLGKINYLPLGSVFFIADETPQLLAKLRCDEDVESLVYNEPVVVAILTSPQAPNFRMQRSGWGKVPFDATAAGR